MKTVVLTLLAVLPIIFLIASCTIAVRKRAQGQSARRVLGRQFASLVVLVALLAGLTLFASAANGDNADAQTPATTQSEQAQESATDNSKGMTMIAAALAVGLAGIGGGVAVASGAPAAIAATSENPKSFAKSMLFVALGEAIAIYGLVIALLMLFT